jgi:Fructose-2,6-bisphosphatase
VALAADADGATAPTAWWWVRHAPVPGPPGVIYGQADVGCDTSDAAAFRAMAQLLPRDAVWITTPLRRTRQTLAAIAAAADAPLPSAETEADFAEQSFGAWEGLGWDEMQRLDPETYAAFWQDPTRNAPPGGESFAGVMARVAEAVERLSQQLRGRMIVAVAHGGSIRAAVAHALGLTPEAAMAVVIDNLSITRLTLLPDGILRKRGGVWRVDAVNAPCRWIPSAGSC